MKLSLIPPEDEFSRQGASVCVVVPLGRPTFIEEIFTLAGGKATIPDGDEAGDDLFVVKIGEGGQEALDQDGLRAALRRNLP